MGCKIQPKPPQIHSSASSSLQPISPKHETEMLLYDSAQPLQNSLDLVSWGNKFLTSFLWEEKNHNKTHLLELQPHPLQNHCSFNLYNILDSKQQKGSSVQQHAVLDRTTQVPPQSGDSWREVTDTLLLYCSDISIPAVIALHGRQSASADPVQN